MTDLTDVLQRATADLEPTDLDALLAGALRRGRSRRRRRRVGVAATAVGLAGVTAVVVIAGSALRSGPGIASDPATAGHATRAVPSPSAEPSIAVRRDQVGETFARVVPGTITDEHDTSASRVHEEGGYESSFRWNGFRVALAMWPYAGDSHAQCRDATRGSLGNQTCVRVSHGWAVHDRMMDDTDLNRWVSVFRDDGYRVWVLIYNSGSEKGSAAAGPPPLDVPALEKVATSELWFS